MRNSDGADKLSVIRKYRKHLIVLVNVVANQVKKCLMAHIFKYLEKYLISNKYF